MIRRRWYWALAAIALLALLYGAAWLWWAKRGLDALDRQVEILRGDGFTVSHDPASVSGFPLAHALDFATPFVGAPNAAWWWRGERITLRSRPWIPTQITARLDGLHRVAVAPGPVLYDLSLGQAELAVTARLSGGADQADLSLTDARLALPGGRTLEIASLFAAVAADSKPNGAPALAIALDASDAALPAGTGAALGDALRRLRFDGVLTRANLSPLEGGGRLDAAALTAWRDAGGRLAVRRLVVAWGPVDATAAGDLTLDAALRPAGRLNVALRGWEALLDAFVAAGSLGPSASAAAKIILSMMAQPAPDGGPPALTLPLLAQEGRLYLGPVKLASLPPIFPVPL